MASLYVEDDLSYEAYDPPSLQEGRAWSSTQGDEFYASITRPIGFMRRKPRVRVKAWMMPIVET